MHMYTPLDQHVIRDATRTRSRSPSRPVIFKLKFGRPRWPQTLVQPLHRHGRRGKTCKQLISTTSLSPQHSFRSLLDHNVPYYICGIRRNPMRNLAMWRDKKRVLFLNRIYRRRHKLNHPALKPKEARQQMEELVVLGAVRALLAAHRVERNVKVRFAQLFT